MALWIGVYPKPFFQILEQPVNRIVQTIHDKSNAEVQVNAQVAPAAVPPALAVVEPKGKGPRIGGPKVVRPNVVGTKSAGPKASN